MALKQIRIGSLVNIGQYDDGDYGSAIETDQQIRAGQPIALDGVLRLADVGSLAGNVFGPASAVVDNLTSFSNIDGKHLKDSGIAAADVSDAVSKRHTQGTDIALGVLGTKNPPIDADKVIYRDSANADALVTSTWAQTKAFLKTYFDTVYGGLGVYLPLAGGTMTGGIINSTSINPLTTLAESWIGPSSTTGVYFKGGKIGFGTITPSRLVETKRVGAGEIALFGDGTEGLLLQTQGGIGGIIGYNGAAYNDLDLRATTGTGSGIYMPKTGGVGIGTQAPAAAFKVDIIGGIQAAKTRHSETSGGVLSVGSYCTSDNTNNNVSAGNFAQGVNGTTSMNNAFGVSALLQVANTALLNVSGYALQGYTYMSSSGKQIGIYAGVQSQYYGTSAVADFSLFSATWVGGSTTTFDNLYGLKLPALLAGMAATNHYGVYQEDANAKNYFNGIVGIKMSPTYTLDVTGNIRCSTGFGCNSKTPQTAYASGGALSAYSAGLCGFDTDAHAQEIHTLLTNIRAALVANGIMS